MALAPVDAAIFLDRDGLLNELVYYPDSREWESPRTPGDLRLRPGTVELVGGLREDGWPLFLVSNQPSAAKGKTGLRDLQAVHEVLMARLASPVFTEVFYCHHHPDAVVMELRGPCACRKPSPFFLQQASARYHLDLHRCWMIGDQDTDVICGRAAGCQTLLVPNPNSANKRGKADPDHTCDDLAQVLRFFRHQS